MKTTIWMVERKVKEKAWEKAMAETDDIAMQGELAEKYEDQLLGKIFDMVHRGEIEI